LAKGVQTLPTYQRVDKYPLTRDMLRANNRDPCDLNDIEKSGPGTAYGLYPRKVKLLQNICKIFGKRLYNRCKTSIKHL
jgi:hypothetical protein